jgi:amino acid transporter
MVLVLYTYGGWNDAAFVTAEIRDPRRNIPRALFLGIGIITFLYLLMNVAYMKSLGFEGLRTAGAPAADVLKLSVGMWASKSMSLLVMISGLGAINGMLLTGSRVFLALGQDHPLFAGLGRWYTKRGAPVWSLLAQAGVALLMIVMVGTRAGRALIDTVFRWLRMPPLDWSDFVGGFETLIAGTAPVFWFFFLLTGISLLVLRIKDRGMARGFSVPLFPVPPLIFCGMCLFMLWSSVTYAKSLSLLGILPLAAGLPLYVVSQRRRDAK